MNNITGFVTYQESNYKTQELNLILTSNQTLQHQIELPNNIRYFSINGNVTGVGKITIEVLEENNSFVVYDKNLNKNKNLITGFVTKDNKIKKDKNDTLDEENETEEIIIEINETEEVEEEINTTINETEELEEEIIIEINETEEVEEEINTTINETEELEEEIIIEINETEELINNTNETEIELEFNDTIIIINETNTTIEENQTIEINTTINDTNLSINQTEEINFTDINTTIEENQTINITPIINETINQTIEINTTINETIYLNDTNISINNTNMSINQTIEINITEILPQDIFTNFCFQSCNLNYLQNSTLLITLEGNLTLNLISYNYINETEVILQTQQFENITMYQNETLNINLSNYFNYTTKKIFFDITTEFEKAKIKKDILNLEPKQEGIFTAEILATDGNILTRSNEFTIFVGEEFFPTFNETNLTLINETNLTIINQTNMTFDTSNSTVLVIDKELLDITEPTRVIVKLKPLYFEEYVEEPIQTEENETEEINISLNTTETNTTTNETIVEESQEITLDSLSYLIEEKQDTKLHGFLSNRLTSTNKISKLPDSQKEIIKVIEKLKKNIPEEEIIQYLDLQSEIYNEIQPEYFITLVEELNTEEQYQIITINPEDLDNLLASQYIESIQIDKPISFELQEALEIINYTKLEQNNFTQTGTNKKICVLDTGIDTNKVTFNNLIQYDFGENDEIAEDINGHGTTMAKIIKSIAPDVTLIMGKVFDNLGNGYESNILQGLQFCEEQNADVISLSIGAGQSTGLCDANAVATKVNQLVNKGIPVFVSTGNDASTNVKIPACARYATRVSSTTKENILADFANVNFWTDILAPSQNLEITFEDQTSTIISGTSLATPIIASSIILLSEQNNINNYDELNYRLRSTAIPINYTVPNSYKIKTETNTTTNETYNITFPYEINLSRIDILALLQNNKQMEPFNYSPYIEQGIFNLTDYITLADSSRDCFIPWWFAGPSVVTCTINNSVGCCNKSTPTSGYANFSVGTTYTHSDGDTYICADKTGMANAAWIKIDGGSFQVKSNNASGDLIFAIDDSGNAWLYGSNCTYTLYWYGCLGLPAPGRLRIGTSSQVTNTSALIIDTFGGFQAQGYFEDQTSFSSSNDAFNIKNSTGDIVAQIYNDRVYLRRKIYSEQIETTACKPEGNALISPC